MFKKYEPTPVKYISGINLVSVSPAQPWRDKAPFIRKSEGWISKEAMSAGERFIPRMRNGAWDSLA